MSEECEGLEVKEDAKAARARRLAQYVNAFAQTLDYGAMGPEAASAVVQEYAKHLLGAELDWH